MEKKEKDHTNEAAEREKEPKPSMQHLQVGVKFANFPLFRRRLVW